MSAKKIEQGVERCACGALPCIHKSQAGDEFIYVVSCTRCGVQTDIHGRTEDAVSDWNEGKVELPAEDFPLTQARATGRLFNPVMS